MQEGFLGTGATFAADLTLVAYILLIVPAMIVGFVFARRKMFAPHHKWVMTLIVNINWILIIIVMAVSYAGGVAPGLSENLADPPILIPTIHLLTGGLAQIIGTYLIILMWTENTPIQWVLPDALRVKNIKVPMRLTLTLWIVTVVLGIGIYLTWYMGSPAADDSIPPAATEEAVPAAGDDEGPVATEAVTEETSDVEESGDDAPEPAATEAVTEETSDAEESGDDAPEPATTEEAE